MKLKLIAPIYAFELWDSLKPCFVFVCLLNMGFFVVKSTSKSLTDWSDKFSTCDWVQSCCIIWLVSSKYWQRSEFMLAHRCLYAVILEVSSGCFVSVPDHRSERDQDPAAAQTRERGESDRDLQNQRWVSVQNMVQSPVLRRWLWG